MDNLGKKFNLNDYQKEQFTKYYEFLISENQKINLTAITDKQEVYIKHFYDSLLISETINLNEIKTLCDIGSGAGFPSIPLKILFPHLRVTIIEPIRKRTSFLEQLVKLLNLDNVQIITGRAEDVVIDYRESFDLVVARAVAKLNMLLELCLPYVKIGGYFVAMKGKNFEEEFNESQKAIKTLGGLFIEYQLFDLPMDMGMRSLIKITKQKPTKNIYPRHFSKIKKNPL